jgi:hypothetical protein
MPSITDSRHRWGTVETIQVGRKTEVYSTVLTWGLYVVSFHFIQTLSAYNEKCQGLKINMHSRGSVGLMRSLCAVNSKLTALLTLWRGQ